MDLTKTIEEFEVTLGSSHSCLDSRRGSRLNLGSVTTVHPAHSAPADGLRPQGSPFFRRAVHGWGCMGSWDCMGSFLVAEFQMDV